MMMGDGHTCTHTHAHIPMHTPPCIYTMHTYPCIYTHAHILMHIHPCTHIHTYIFIHACAHMPMNTYPCTHMHTPLCTHMWYIQREWKRGRVRDCYLVAENFHLAVLRASCRCWLATGAALLCHPL